MFLLKRKHFDPTDKVRYEYHFIGNVQNIGFRFEIQQRAIQYNITGWAKNNEDGSVTSQLQGNQTDILKLVNELHHIKRIIITNQTMKEIELKKEFKFSILY